MKTLEQFIKELMLIRLDQCNLFKEGENNFISPRDLEKIVYIINESLTYLFSKYILLKKNALIELIENHTTYYIRKEYAETSDSEVPHKYIKDSIYNPFYGNVIQILDVIDENGVALPKNDFNDFSSVFLLEPDVIQFNNLNVGTYFDVIYQANHVNLVVEEIENQYININPAMYELLSYLVAYKILNTYMGQNFLVEAQKNEVAYTKCVNELTLSGILTSLNDVRSSSVFDKTGFI